MKANEYDFSFVENEHQLVIPFFQRAYVWKQDNWEALFRDLTLAFKGNRDHFLGSIILKRSLVGQNSAIVVDGQQRLTTFSILLKATCERLGEEEQRYFSNCFYKTYDNTRAKIEHSYLDRLQYNKIIFSNGDVEDNDNDRIISCYNFFKEELDNVSNDIEFFEFAKYLKSSKLWVAIHLEATEDEQKIFDSINSAGMKLTSTDIIKNALFNTVIQKSNKEVAIDLYQQTWERVFETESMDRNFWNSTVRTGRVHRLHSEILLQAYAIIDGFYDTRENTVEHLSRLYKSFIEPYTFDDLKGLIHELSDVGKYYRLLPFFHSGKIFTCSEDLEGVEHRLFHLLHVADTSTAIPLLLALKQTYGTHRKSRSLLKSSFELIEVYLLLRWVCGYTSKGYNHIFSSLAKDLVEEHPKNPTAFLKAKFTELQGDNAAPSSKQFRSALKGSNRPLVNKVASFLLFWIELKRRYDKNNMYDIVSLQYSYTLEHLMPQSPSLENWGVSDATKDTVQQLIYQIGNMTLLKGGLNSSISNGSWEQKKSGRGRRENTLTKCSELLISKEVLKCDRWTSIEIENRTQSLSDELFQVWNLRMFE